LLGSLSFQALHHQEAIQLLLGEVQRPQQRLLSQVPMPVLLLHGSQLPMMTAHQAEQPTGHATFRVILLPELQEVLVHQTHHVEAVGHDDGIGEVLLSDATVRFRRAAYAAQPIHEYLWLALLLGPPAQESLEKNRLGTSALLPLDEFFAKTSLANVDRPPFMMKSLPSWFQLLQVSIQGKDGLDQRHESTRHGPNSQPSTAKSPSFSINSMIASSPVPSLMVPMTKGRVPRIRRVSCSMTSSDAPT